MREKLRGALVAVCQLVYMPAFWFLAYAVNRAHVTIKPKQLPRSDNEQYLIVANHQSRLDPFVITGILPPKFWPALLPYRYMTANQYLYQPHLWPLLWPLGGFPAYPTHFEGYGLDRASHIIAAGQTVSIFPEGRRTIAGQSSPKKGVAVLANTQNVLLLPVLMQWAGKPRRKVKIVVGEPFDGHGMDETDIMQKVYALGSTNNTQPNR